MDNKQQLNLAKSFLKYIGAHLHVESFSDEIKNLICSKASLKENFFNICDFFYNKTLNDSEIYSKSTILKNALTVNNYQLQKIKKLEEKTGFISIDDYIDEGDNWVPSKNKSIKFKKQIKDFSLNLHNRSIVLYFRSEEAKNNSSTFGVDVFQFIIIYYFLDRYIKERRSKLFNNIYIVSRFNYIPELYYHLFEDLEHRKSESDDFIFNTSFFANTIHFYGGRLPERDLFSIPILCEGFRIQTAWMNLIPRKIFLPFFYYNGFIDSNNNFEPDDDREYYSDSGAFSWKDIVGKQEVKEENYTINNIFNNLKTMILKLEKELLNYKD